MLFFSPTGCKLSPPEVLRSGNWFEKNYKQFKTQSISFVFSFCSPHYCLKNYVLQTEIPNREKDLSLELEIALVTSPVGNSVTRKDARCFLLKHGKIRKWTGTDLGSQALQSHYKSPWRIYLGCNLVWNPARKSLNFARFGGLAETGSKGLIVISAQSLL